MRTFIFAYLTGLPASIPAFAMFNDVGASPFRNFDAIMTQIGDSLTSIVIYFLVVWVVPALGSTVGAKLGAGALISATSMAGAAAGSSPFPSSSASC